MTHHSHNEADERLLDLPHYRAATRAVMDIGLLVGLAGISIPYGLHDLRSYGINNYEWALAALAFIAFIGVVFDLARRPVLPWPFALAAFVWAAQATYAALLPHAVVGARIGLTLLFAGYAIASAGAWRISARYAGREL